MAQHISVRIPWKDNGYNGLVCNKPCFNNTCLRLKILRNPVMMKKKKNWQDVRY